MVQCWFWVTVVGLANDDEEERGDGNSGMGEEDEDDGAFVQLTPSARVHRGDGKKGYTR